MNSSGRRRRFGDLVRGNGRSEALTTSMPIIDDSTAVRILDLAVRIGESMLATGAPAASVTLAIVKVTAAYGMTPVHIDLTYNSITASHHRDGAARPITLLRVVRAAAPDHDKLQRLQSLVTDIEQGLAPDAAYATYREIRRSSFPYRPSIVVVAQALLAVGVAVMYGANALSLLITFVAAALAALTQAMLGKFAVPYFFSQIAGAFVVTIVATLAPLLTALGVPGSEGIRPSVIVASGIVLMLAGLTMVGAAQDAIDGFALTATGRLLELVTHTVGVVIGILIGLEVAGLFDIRINPPEQAPPLGAIPLQLVGAAVIAVTVAITNGAGSRTIAVSALLSLLAWGGYLLGRGIGLDVAASSALGAFVGCVVGIMLAYRLQVPSVAVTTAAILPMVPGLTIFRGLLGVVESGGGTQFGVLVGFSTLVGAATVGVALAVGASLGIYVGQPLRSTLRGVTRARARVRPR